MFLLSFSFQFTFDLNRAKKIALFLDWIIQSCRLKGLYVLRTFANSPPAQKFLIFAPFRFEERHSLCLKKRHSLCSKKTLLVFEEDTPCVRRKTFFVFEERRSLCSK